MRAAPLVRRMVIGIAATYVLLLVATWALQERLLFHPSALPANHVFDFGPDVHETTVVVDGAELSALHLERAGARGLVFFLHGNAGNLEGWFTNTELYRRAGFDLFMIDYRGFGKSTGAIESEAQLHADVRAAWAAIAPRYAGRPVVILGRSLGTGLAAALAAEVNPALTILVSPYRSIEALAGDIYPFVPKAMLRYPLRTEDFVAATEGEVMLVHGERDRLIPIAHSEAIARRTPRAVLLRIPDAGHDDVHAAERYRTAITEALARL